MRLLVCAGMTGGGMYPALAVLQMLDDRVQQVLWVGSQSPMEAAVLQGYNLNFTAIPAAGLHGVGFLSVPGNLIQLLRGWLASKKVIKQFKPDVIFYTGGYVGVPLAMAARKTRSVVFIPDIEPGFAHHFILRKATAAAVTSSDSIPLIRANIAKTVSGYPIRKELLTWSRQKSRDYFGIPHDTPAVLVFGGSKGARSINRALAANLESLLSETHIIHISGQDNWKEVEQMKQSLPPQLSQRYHAFPFLKKEMGAALAAADLAVCRAGASTLGELPAFGLPAILVPYPFAWRYQARNAQYLARQGGAIMIEDQALEGALPDMIQAIIKDPSRLAEMKSAMRKLFIPDAAERIADLISEAGAQVKEEEKSHG